MSYKPRPMPRQLLLSDDITPESVRNIINDIIDINNNDDEQEEVYSNWGREPIYLFINSYGGNVYDGLALVDMIKSSKTPVYTVCVGSCMSMGLWIYLAGTKRFIGHHGTLMFHDVSKSVSGKSVRLEQDLDELKRIGNMLIADIVSSTAITQTELKEYVDHQTDWYIPAKKAIELKIADGYY